MDLSIKTYNNPARAVENLAMNFAPPQPVFVRVCIAGVGVLSDFYVQVQFNFSIFLVLISKVKLKNSLKMSVFIIEYCFSSDARFKKRCLLKQFCLLRFQNRLYKLLQTFGSTILCYFREP